MILGKRISAQEFADRIGRTRYHVYDLIHAGRLPRREGGVNRNRYVLYEQDVTDYLKSIEAPIAQDGAA